MLAPPIPARGAKSEITRAVLHAIEQGRALTITYQSMSSPDPYERSIAPHALAYDGFRWHCRAYCMRDRVFKDIVLGRMLSAELGEPAQVDPKADSDWMTDITLTGPDDGNVAQQREFLESISTACLGSGVDFTWAFDTSGTAHARNIVTDTGWKIVLDRGLDIFQAPVKSGGFSLGDPKFDKIRRNSPELRVAG